MSDVAFNYTTALKHGAAFGPEHALALCRQVHRHMPHWSLNVYTDMALEEKTACRANTVPFLADLPGWWCLLECFRQPGPCVLTGLDTVFTAPVPQLEDAVRSLGPKQVVMTRPPRSGMVPAAYAKMTSMLMAWNGDLSWLYDRFIKNPKVHMNNPRYRLGRNGLRFEQDYTCLQLREEGFEILASQDIQPGIYSFKNQVMPKYGVGLPEDAAVVLFHGRPRPWDMVQSCPWIAEAVSEDA